MIPNRSSRELKCLSQRIALGGRASEACPCRPVAFYSGLASRVDGHSLVSYRLHTECRKRTLIRASRWLFLYPLRKSQGKCYHYLGRAELPRKNVTRSLCKREFLSFTSWLCSIPFNLNMLDHRISLGGKEESVEASTVLPELHSEKKYWSCPQCPSSFKRSENLKRHQRGHDESRRFICQICDKSFARR